MLQRNEGKFTVRKHTLLSFIRDEGRPFEIGQAAVQPYIDNAISKTINIPENYPFKKLQDVYTKAFVLGLKGMHVFSRISIISPLPSQKVGEGTAAVIEPAYIESVVTDGEIVLDIFIKAYLFDVDATSR